MEWRPVDKAVARRGRAALGPTTQKDHARGGLNCPKRLERHHGFRPHKVCNGGWREDGQIGVAAFEPIEADLTIPYGCKLASQNAGRRAVLGRRPESVDNSDTRVRLERGHEVVKEGVGLSDLMIHVNQDCNIDCIRR